MTSNAYIRLCSLFLMLLICHLPTSLYAQPVDRYYETYKDTGNPWEGEWSVHNPPDYKGYLRIERCSVKSCDFILVSSGSINLHAGITLDDADNASAQLKTDPVCQIHFKRLPALHAIEVRWTYACPSQGWRDSNAPGEEMYEWKNSLSEISKRGTFANAVQK
jgi:hypothetical protein